MLDFVPEYFELLDVLSLALFYFFQGSQRVLIFLSSPSLHLLGLLDSYLCTTDGLARGIDQHECCCQLRFHFSDVDLELVDVLVGALDQVAGTLGCLCYFGIHLHQI